LAKIFEDEEAGPPEEDLGKPNKRAVKKIKKEHGESEESPPKKSRAKKVKDEDGEEEKPKPKPRTRKVKKEESEDELMVEEEKPKPARKPRGKNVKKEESEDEKPAPVRKPRAKKIKKEESEDEPMAEEEKPKPARKPAAKKVKNEEREDELMAEGDETEAKIELVKKEEPAEPHVASIPAKRARKSAKKEEIDVKTEANDGQLVTRPIKKVRVKKVVKKEESPEVEVKPAVSSRAMRAVKREISNSSPDAKPAKGRGKKDVSKKAVKAEPETDDEDVGVDSGYGENDRVKVAEH
jgi:hypothetical protein